MKKIRRLNLIWLIPLWLVVGLIFHVFDYVESINKGVVDYWRGEL